MNSRISRYFVRQGLAAPNGSIRLDKHAANYFSRTLRLKPGDAVILFDGAGQEWLARVQRLSKSDAELELAHELDKIAESALGITLIQGLAKSDAMDWIVRKCTEIGVSRIVPAYSKFSVVKLDPERSQRRKTHWESVAHAACSQSGRHFAPDISLPVPFSEAIAAANGVSLRWILDPAGPTDLAQCMRGPRPENAVLAIGPEGGFCDEELELAKAAGFTPIRLGPRILRADTAAVVAAGIVQSLWGDMQGESEN